MTKHYPVNLVGEQFYQRAVIGCEVGDVVDVCIETGNPHDPQALVVKSRTKPALTLGYVPTGSFVRGVFFEQGCSVAAAVAGVFPGRRGFRELKLIVSVVEVPPEVVVWSPGEAADWNEPEPPAATLAQTYEPELTNNTGRNTNLIALGLGIALMFLLVRCIG